MNQMHTHPVRITHLGGPTALIEIGQLRLLTDPTFDPAGSRYANGPVEVIKKTGPALTVSELGAGGLHVHVTATPVRHGPRKLKEVLGEEVVRDVTGWIIEWDGQRHGVLYVSGDTVFFEELQEIPQRYQIGTALLHFGAAHFDVLGPAYLTLTAAERARFAKALGEAIIIPRHYEGWVHFTEGRAEIEQTFAAAGLEQRLHFLPLGQRDSIDA